MGPVEKARRPSSWRVSWKLGESHKLDAVTMHLPLNDEAWTFLGNFRNCSTFVKCTWNASDDIYSRTLDNVNIASGKFFELCRVVFWYFFIVMWLKVAKIQVESSVCLWVRRMRNFNFIWTWSFQCKSQTENRIWIKQGIWIIRRCSVLFLSLEIHLVFFLRKTYSFTTP